MKRILSLALILASLAMLPSCITVGGTSYEHCPTIGQELIDLKSALDKGTITQAEYDKSKADILARGVH